MYNFYPHHPHFYPNPPPPPTKAAGYATIPTSAANSAYIIGNLGQLINSSQQNILQHQQTNKPGEMQKVLDKYFQDSHSYIQNLHAQ